MQAKVNQVSPNITERMKLKSFSNEELNLSFKAVAQKEREILSEVIFHIAEVEKRDLHLEMGYSSVFAYMTEFIGYERSTAQRRIDAARLSYEVPSVIEDLKEGSIKLGQIEFLQKATRLAKQQFKNKLGDQNIVGNDDRDENNKERNSDESLSLSKEDAPLTAIEKTTLIESLKNKSVQDSQKLISKALNVEVKQNPKITIQANGSVRQEVTYTKEQWAKLTEMRELLSHSLLNGSEWDQVFEYVADKVIAQKGPKTKNENRKTTEVSSGVGGTTSIEAGEKVKAEVVPADLAKKNNIETEKPMSYEKLRAIVIARDQCCQYQNAKTKKKCGSKWKLEADHINPRWAGGEDTLENLRAYCANHNQYLYRTQAGIRRH